MSPRSCIYEGTVRHRRFSPVEHRFRYSLFMMYLDLGELPGVLDRFPLWSARRPAPAWFRERDYLAGDTAGPDRGVRDLVEARTGVRPAGPIRVLTHLRYFGVIFNPVTFYYVFPREEAAGGDPAPEFIVAEITNTPWRERHAYVLDRRGQGTAGGDTPAAGPGPDAGMRGHTFTKEFHVSPFMPMDVRYRWYFNTPGEGLSVHMENHRAGERFFDATLTLRRRELSGSALRSVLFRHPVMTGTVLFGIHFQALRLRLKGAAFHPHPARGRTA